MHSFSVSDEIRKHPQASLLDKQFFDPLAYNMKNTSMVAASSCSTYQHHISQLASSITPRVLKYTSGSGNYGEQGISAWYTIDKLPGPLHNLADTRNPRALRLNIDLGPNRIAFYIDNVLTHEEADALASCAESILESNGHSRMAPGINTPPGMRVNEAAHWFPPSEKENSAKRNFLEGLMGRILPFVPTKLENGLNLFPKISEKFAQFKYNKGDRFDRHVDGIFPGQGINELKDGVDEWVGVVSGFSMLFYLNDNETDGLEGGETRLWTADGSRHVDIQPRKGRVLFFRRGSPTAVMHAGLPVTGDVPKYIALVNLAYGEQTGTQPLVR